MVIMRFTISPLVAAIYRIVKIVSILVSMPLAGKL